jgi:hypothetical protein
VALDITHFTDPAGLAWSMRMIVLTLAPGEAAPILQRRPALDAGFYRTREPGRLR